MANELMRLRQFSTDFTEQELSACKNQILQGLNKFHQNGLIHGDIRPLFIGCEKEKSRLFLLDNLKMDVDLDRVQLMNL